MSDSDDIYQRLIAPVEGPLKSTVLRTVRNADDAADVLQDVLSQVWRELPRIERHPSPHGYIMRIAVSRCFDFLRKEARRPRQAALDGNPDLLRAAPVPDPLHSRETLAAIRAAIGLLPPKQGRVVLLKVVNEYSYAQISGVMGFSEATARSHFARARTRLEKILVRLGVIHRRGELK